MDIFNYLMNKKGHEIFKNNDILSYLLKKGRIHTASGTEINITNAKGFHSLEMTKLSTQTGTPTPENPVEVNTVKGYRNLFSGDYSQFDNTGGEGELYDYFKLPHNTTYTLTLIAKNDFTGNGSTYLGFTGNGGNANNGYIWLIRNATNVHKGDILTYTTNEYGYISMYSNNATTLQLFMDNFYIMLTESETQLPYVPYGSNYIYTTITDGTNSKIITIPLNNNEVCGIGDYKDELLIDKDGKCYLNKKIGKLLNEIAAVGTLASGYVYGYKNALWSNKKVGKFGGICNKALFSADRTPNTFYENDRNFAFVGDTNDTLETMQQKYNGADVYYVLAEENLIDLNYTVDLTLYSGTNTITNSENMDMVLEYYK